VAALRRRARARIALLDSRPLTGALAGAAAISAVTGLVYLLRPYVPVLSLGTLYVLAVLPVAVLWGRASAIGVSLASTLAFNFLFLPPTLTFTLSGEENWLVFLVYVVTGILVSDLAARARRRAHEAEQREREAFLLAEVSTALLSGARVLDELPRIATATAVVLGLPASRIELDGPARGRPGETAVELRAGGRRAGTLYCAAGSRPGASAHRRFLPALASLLAIASDRERLAQEALEAEALRRSDAIKTALLRTVSHDLRSPLTAIRASLEALDSADLALDEADRRTLLGSALAESKRLDRIVRNLLDLSRIQAGAALPAPRLQTVEGLIDQALTHAGDADRRVRVSLAADLPLVNVDAVQLEHAVANLLENALKFSPPGAPVTVEATRRSSEVLIRVGDAGPGLPAGELEQIFEPFRHASAASERKGAGLGLAIAKGFVEANGGRIWAESPAGGGASLCLALPAALEPARALA
jgi:two-component system sensor histidine kinase KdpD